MKATIDYKRLHLTPLEELIDADFGMPGTPERNAFDESAQRFVEEYSATALQGTVVVAKIGKESVKIAVE